MQIKEMQIKELRELLNNYVSPLKLHDVLPDNCIVGEFVDSEEYIDDERIVYKNVSVFCKLFHATDEERKALISDVEDVVDEVLKDGTLRDAAIAAAETIKKFSGCDVEIYDVSLYNPAFKTDEEAYIIIIKDP